MHTPCDCTHGVLQISSQLRNQRVIEFEAVLDIGCRIATQWEAVIDCANCRSHRQSIVILPMVAEQVLALYEVACSTYAISQLDSGTGDHPGPGYSAHATRPSTDRWVCQKSRMMLGQLELEEHDAKLLARVLLNRDLQKLGVLLEDLTEMVGELWSETWAQQTGTLRACEASISLTMEKLMILISQLR